MAVLNLRNPCMTGAASNRSRMPALNRRQDSLHPQRQGNDHRQAKNIRSSVVRPSPSVTFWTICAISEKNSGR